MSSLRSRNQFLWLLPDLVFGLRATSCSEQASARDSTGVELVVRPRLSYPVLVTLPRPRLRLAQQTILGINSCGRFAWRRTGGSLRSRIQFSPVTHQPSKNPSLYWGFYLVYFYDQVRTDFEQNA